MLFEDSVIMIEIYKHFEVYDKEMITPIFQPRTRPSRSDRMLILPIAIDGIWGLQHISFYYRSVITWDNLPKDVPIDGTLGLFIQTSPGYGLERQSNITQISGILNIFL